MKYCNKCTETKPLDDFHRKRSALDGRQTWCILCMQIMHKDWYQHNKEKVRLAQNGDPKRMAYYRRNHVIKRSGMTPEEFVLLPRVCAICGRDDLSLCEYNGQYGAKSLQIDHDHETGAFRGLLCSSCNKGLGLYRDDPALLRAAADYIEKARVV